METLYLNGEYIAPEDAMISVMDRAVLFGDALYEVIPVYNGRLIGEREHIDRLHQGEQATQIPSPLTHEQWHTVFTHLLECNNALEGNHMIYLQVSRGTEAKRRHAWSEGTQPTVFAYVDQLPKVDLAIYRQGKKVISQVDIRRETCFIKSTALQVNTIMQHQAKATGAVEVILFRDEQLTEGSATNVFIYKDNTLMTPPANQHILNGVTRRMVIELAKKELNIEVQECSITREQLLQADEVWLTSSTKEVCPITLIDDQVINNGKVGPLWEKMIQCYRHATGCGHLVEK